VVIAGDALRRETWGLLDREYDIVLGNPPFLATSEVPDRAYLEATFETAHGRFDFAHLFIEQALSVIGTDGLIGMVVPNRMFRNTSARPVRELLVRKTNMLTLVDFGSARVFKDASAYVGCVVARRIGANERPATIVRVLEVVSISAQFVGAALLDADEGRETTAPLSVRAFDATHPRDGGPWMLLSPIEVRAKAALSVLSERLDTIADVFQGIRTGANDLFILTIVSDDDRVFCRVVNGVGEEGTIETDLLVPVIFGADVRRNSEVVPTRHLLYPYRNNTLLSEAELEQRYPCAYNYLLGYRDLLSSRASLVASRKRWYELIRQREEDWLRSPKLLIRDLAPSTAFAIDELGSTFLVSGSAVVPSDPALLRPLLAYLNSAIVNDLVRQTTPQFRGSFQKFEPQHLSQIPILRRILEDEGFAAVLGDLATQAIDAVKSGDSDSEQQADAAVNQVVADAFKSSGITVGP
jgi:hypothetical protein